MNGRQIHRSGTRLLSLLMMIVGFALIAQAVSGSGSFIGRLLLGVLFLAAGMGRLYVEARRGDRG